MGLVHSFTRFCLACFVLPTLENDLFSQGLLREILLLVRLRMPRHSNHAKSLHICSLVVAEKRLDSLHWPEQFAITEKDLEIKVVQSEWRKLVPVYCLLCGKTLGIFFESRSPSRFDWASLVKIAVEGILGGGIPHHTFGTRKENLILEWVRSF